jgi:hypothetical protein
MKRELFSFTAKLARNVLGMWVEAIRILPKALLKHTSE